MEYDEIKIEPLKNLGQTELSYEQKYHLKTLINYVNIRNKNEYISKFIEDWIKIAKTLNMF